MTYLERHATMLVMHYREGRGHAIMLASILWIAAVVLVLWRSGDRDMLGHLKGADFVHFYTLGHVGLSHDTALLYDTQALHNRQVELVPDSAFVGFIPVYPPQTALLFAPFARLPYCTAALVWALVSTVVYVLVIWTAWLSVADAIPDRIFVIAAAAGFPPFWNLILHGQTTVWPLAAFWLGWMALERSRPFVAGLALGLLAIKPPLTLAIAVVILACSEWPILIGALTSVAVQSIAATIVLGSSVWPAYIETLMRLPDLSHLLEPKPYQLHSLRAVANVLPTPFSTGIWLIASAFVLWQTIRVWRSAVPVAVRIGIVVIATVLVSPHLTVYDATILALPIVWLGGWIMQERQEDLARIFWPAVYWLFVALLVPTALLIRVQISVLLLGWLFVRMTTAIVSIPSMTLLPAERFTWKAKLK